jgi:hypothetical protein
MKSLKPLLAITILAFTLAPCALVLITPAAAAGNSDESAVAGKLKQMETAWGDALTNKDHGLAVVTNMVADDYAGINSKGKMQTKAGLLKEMKDEPGALTASTTDSMEVHSYGSNVATVCGTSTEKGKDKDGKAFTHKYGWVDTWMERDGKWQCVAEGGMLLTEKK